MKKGLIIGVATVLMLNSCATHTGSGAYIGSSIGMILGDAIGGIVGGPRGSDFGTVIGMAGGAVVGAAVGAQADKREVQEVSERYERIQRNKARGYNPYEKDGVYSNVAESSADESGFDATNSGDDRIYDFETQQPTNAADVYMQTLPAQTPSDTQFAGDASSSIPNIEIANVQFIDGNGDGILSKKEIGKIVFEIKNKGSQPLYNFQPSVVNLGNERGVYISPTVFIERLAPNETIRYTAMVTTAKRIKRGNLTFELTVIKDRRSISKVAHLDVKTSKQ